MGKRVADMTKTCTRCGESKALEMFHVLAHGRSGRHPRCKTCRSTIGSKTRKPRPPCRSLTERSAYYSAWSAKNAEARRAYNAKWRADNADRFREMVRQWGKANSHKRNAYKAQRRAAKLRRTPAWANHTAIAAVYDLAVFCNRICGTADVDHVLPLQGDVVSGLHVHQNLRVLPAVENQSKGNMLPAEFNDWREAA